MTQSLPQDFDELILPSDFEEQLIEQMNNQEQSIPDRKFKGLTEEELEDLKISTFFTAYNLLCSTRNMNIAYENKRICGIKIVKSFRDNNGIDLPATLFKTLARKYRTFKKLRQYLNFSNTLGCNTALVHIYTAIFQTLLATSKYVFNTWWKQNQKYPIDSLWRDLKKIWVKQLIAAGVTYAIVVSLATSLVAAGVTAVWTFIITCTVGNIIGKLVSWKCTHKSTNINTKFAEKTRENIYKAYARKENAANNYNKNEAWPEELTELVWIFESMDCLSFTVEGKLDAEKVNKAYKRKSKDIQVLSGFEKLDKQGLWVFRRTILLRYVIELQESKTKVEEVIKEACKIRLHEINNSQSGQYCLIM